MHADLPMVSHSTLLFTMQPLSPLCGCLAVAHQHLALQHVLAAIKEQVTELHKDLEISVCSGWYLRLEVDGS